MCVQHEMLDAGFQKVGTKKFKALPQKEKATYQKMYVDFQPGGGSLDKDEKSEDREEDDGHKSATISPSIGADSAR